MSYRNVNSGGKGLSCLDVYVEDGGGDVSAVHAFNRGEA